MPALFPRKVRYFPTTRLRNSKPIDASVVRASDRSNLPLSIFGSGQLLGMVDHSGTEWLPGTVHEEECTSTSEGFSNGTASHLGAMEVVPLVSSHPAMASLPDRHGRVRLGPLPKVSYGVTRHNPVASTQELKSFVSAGSAGTTRVANRPELSPECWRQCVF